jgi:predicted amidohydrolase YtcJ
VGSALVDVMVEADRIAAIGPRLSRVPGAVEIDAQGGALLPGLHDHHLHLRSLVASRSSAAVGPPHVRDPRDFAEALRRAAGALPAGTWLRAVGYHESVAGDLDRFALDRIVADRPVRVQHRSGALWMCNSAGLGALRAAAAWEAGIERDELGRPTGRLWRMDGWLADRLGPAGTTGATAPPDGGLEAISEEAATLGITGWTDATPGRSAAEARSLAAAVAAGSIRQRLHLMVAPSTDPGVTSDVEQVPSVTTGPVKVLLDDPDLPSLDDLTGLVARAHESGRAVAVHCVTRVQLLLTLAALEQAPPGEGDRIEHGAMIPIEALPRLANRNLVVVTQPGFVADRGDQYLRAVAADELPDLWRGRSLIGGRVKVAAGTDAPFGSPDPWRAIRAAVQRRTGSGQVLGGSEAVDPATALRWWWGSASAPARPRRLAPGEPGDLVVLGMPLDEALAGADPVPVAATIVAGRVVFSR